MAILTASQIYNLNSKSGKKASDAQLGSSILKASGSFTTVGGDASESITVTDLAATDLVIVTVTTAGATPRSIVAAAAGSGAIAVTMSGDPSNDHVLSYFVFSVRS